MRLLGELWAEDFFMCCRTYRIYRAGYRLFVSVNNWTRVNYAAKTIANDKHVINTILIVIVVVRVFERKTSLS